MAKYNPLSSDRTLKNRINLYFDMLNEGDNIPTVEGLALYIEVDRSSLIKAFEKYSRAKDYFACLCVERLWKLSAIKEGDKKNTPLYSPRLIEFYLKNNFSEYYKSDNSLAKEEIKKDVIGEILNVKFSNTSKNKI